jgi:hypothetical protein
MSNDDSTKSQDWPPITGYSDETEALRRNQGQWIRWIQIPLQYVILLTKRF